jgi:hypothetical protein
MSSHNLNIEVLDTNNENVLTIIDSSVYNSLLPLSCQELLITPPGFQFSASIDPALLTPGYNLAITACMLEIQTSGCDARFDTIPDGIYAIRYSVSPNEYVKTETNHFRMTKTYNRWKKALCDLDLSNCLPEQKKQDKLNQLQNVDMFLKAAKATAEVCRDADRAKKIFDYAVKLLDRIDCKNCG